jgi:hypothetical protein
VPTEQELAGQAIRGELEVTGDEVTSVIERPEVSPPHLGDVVLVADRPFRIDKLPEEAGPSGSMVAWRVTGRFMERIR